MLKRLLRPLSRVELVLFFAIAAGLTAFSTRTASAITPNCVEICTSTFGTSFRNDRGDYFLLKDCAGV